MVELRKCQDCGKKTVTKRKRCAACEKARWRNNNPLKACYQNLKTNAKRRGVGFYLTFEQFKAFAVKTEYINKRGRTSGGYHIDRINPSIGYRLDNLQTLTNAENVRKMHIDRHYNGTEMLFVTRSFIKEKTYTGPAPF